MNELWLVPIAFFTSTLAGIMGLGGGVLLIMLMPGLVPPQAIIPLHAVTQLASNVSRALFGWRYIDARIIPPFAVGAVFGAWLGAEVYQQLALEWLPAVIGLFILVITWVPLPGVIGTSRLSLGLLGFYQTGLAMVIGATGPLGASVLRARNTDRDWLVVNTAAYMSLGHALRALAFILLGFSFYVWWQLLCAMVLATVTGSWFGTRLGRYLPQLNFERVFRWMLTLLALRLVLEPLWATFSPAFVS